MGSITMSPASSRQLRLMPRRRRVIATAPGGGGTPPPMGGGIVTVPLLERPKWYRNQPTY